MKKIFSILLLISLSGCSDDDGPKDEHGLPIATQTGENTFGCLVNGKRYTPSGYYISFKNLEFNYDGYDGISIYVQREDWVANYRLWHLVHEC